MSRISWGLAVWVVLATPATARAWQTSYEDEPIRYLKAQATDPVARLKTRIDKGEARLKRDDEQGYLRSVLKELDVPISSQTLVFSKTSFQHRLISPRTPRALYFNDEVYVGYVPHGEVVEVSAADPRLGGVFYLVDQDDESPKATFHRTTHECLQCHVSSKTMDIPGHMVRSVYPDGSGRPEFRAGSFTTTQASPFEERWGGWYVTGTHGKARHMGNIFVTDQENPERLDRGAGANVIDLRDRFDATQYLTPHSDIVALMVLTHQVDMHNHLAVAGQQARRAVHMDAGVNKALGRPADYVSETSKRMIDRAVERLLRCMLYVDEAPLTDPVSGTSSFAREFSARGRRDRQGRSLRDFDLKTRLFRYPCSYLIESKTFDELPQEVKDRIGARLREILSGKDTSPDFAKISAEDRRAALDILLEVKPDLMIGGAKSD